MDSTDEIDALTRKMIFIQFGLASENGESGQGIIDTKENVFFNQNVPISDLRKLGEDDNVNKLFDKWEQTQKKYNAWVSASGSPAKFSPIKPSLSFPKFPFLISPPPGFENITPKTFSDLSTESETSPSRMLRKIIPLPTNEVKLKPAPIKFGWTKREQRGLFNKEEISSERYTGTIKFYQLKKRLGFIKLDLDGSDIFLCEDDLVISMINIKKFKEAIYNKLTISMRFLIKKYFESTVEKRKAVDIELIEIK
jgi:hypothetical protein